MKKMYSMMGSRFALSVIFAFMTLSISACGSDDSSGTTDGDDNPGGCTDNDLDEYCAETDDCDDGNPDINPGASEVCDGIDNNCNLIKDEGCPGVACYDNDTDGYYGNTDECPNGEDCLDSNEDVFPGAPELCDGLDNDCNDSTDEGCDSDGDGPDGDISDGEKPDGDITDATDGDAVEADGDVDIVDGDFVDVNESDGDTEPVDGDTIETGDGDASDGDSSDGDLDGDLPDGDSSDGDVDIPYGLMINEFRYDDVGTDGEEIFIELYGPSGQDLSGCILKKFNRNTGEAVATIDLSGYLVPADAYFVIGYDDPANVLDYTGTEADMLSEFADNVNFGGSWQLSYNTGNSTVVLDTVGYGDGSALLYEGLPCPDVSFDYALSRNPDHVDTDHNLTDFSPCANPTPGASNTECFSSDGDTDGDDDATDGDLSDGDLSDGDDIDEIQCTACEDGACPEGYSCFSYDDTQASWCVKDCTNDGFCPAGSDCLEAGPGLSLCISEVVEAHCSDNDLTFSNACGYDLMIECRDGAELCNADSFSCDENVSTEVDCSNNVDDDTDGFTDCEDYDCSFRPACGWTGIQCSPCEIGNLATCSVGFDCLAWPDVPDRPVCVKICAEQSDCPSDTSCFIDQDLSNCIPDELSYSCIENNLYVVDSCDIEHLEMECNGMIHEICDAGLMDCIPAIDGDVIDGDVSDGDLIDGDVTDGDLTDGDMTDGDIADGDLTDGDLTDGDVTDGDLTDGDITDGDITDGDLTDGDIVITEEFDCTDEIDEDDDSLTDCEDPDCTYTVDCDWDGMQCSICDLDIESSCAEGYDCYIWTQMPERPWCAQSCTVQNDCPPDTICRIDDGYPNCIPAVTSIACVANDAYYTDSCGFEVLGADCNDASESCNDVTGACDDISQWICSGELYNGDNGCDCGCGLIDPDCESGGCTTPECWNVACEACHDGNGSAIDCADAGGHQCETCGPGAACSAGYTCITYTGTEISFCVLDCDNGETCPADSSCVTQDTDHWCIPDILSASCSENDVYYHDACGNQTKVAECDDALEICNPNSGECDAIIFVEDDCSNNADDDDDSLTDCADDDCTYDTDCGWTGVQCSICDINDSAGTCAAGYDCYYWTELPESPWCAQACTLQEDCPPDSICRIDDGYPNCIPSFLDYACHDNDVYLVDSCSTEVLNTECADGTHMCNDATGECDDISLWNCNPAYYNGNDECDCGCGLVDPDCEDGGCAAPNCWEDACYYCYDEAGSGIDCATAGGQQCDACGSGNNCSQGYTCINYTGTDISFCVLDCDLGQACPTDSSCITSGENMWCVPNILSASCADNDVHYFDACGFDILYAECDDATQTCNPVTYTCDGEGPQCSGSCDASYCVDSQDLCFCSASTYSQENCTTAVCAPEGYDSGSCYYHDTQATAFCSCSYSDCSDVQTYCTGLLYNNCTCAASDPCNWQNDQYCDDTCMYAYPGDYFNDAADCAKRGSGTINPKKGPGW